MLFREHAFERAGGRLTIVLRVEVDGMGIAARKDEGRSEARAA